MPGFKCATGDVIAYTDSDCIADPDWLTHLVHQLMQSGAAAVGGPNLTPDDGWLAACVAAAPGQPTHVLVSDQVAEHIPGCNMAFRREALEAINGFDPQFLKAGDDVDICWRLQHEGLLITFAPGAFVWHHRRQNPRSYLKQQAGYGEAEALLQSKHPDKFNGRGDGKWGGVMYGAVASGPSGRSRRSSIAARSAPECSSASISRAHAHWAMLPSTFEWQVAALLLGLAGRSSDPLGWVVGARMLGLSIWSPSCKRPRPPWSPAHATQACPTPHRRALLCPAARPVLDAIPDAASVATCSSAPIRRRRMAAGQRLSLTGYRSVAYWSETGSDRTEILRRAVAFMDEHRWGKVLDTGWFDWDMAVYCDSGLILKVVTVQEEHGQGKRLIRIRYQLGPTARMKVARRGQPRRARDCRRDLSPVAMAAAALLLGLGVRAWVRGLAAATRLIALFGALRMS